MGSPMMFIDTSKNAYVELVQLYLGKPMDPRPTYSFPNMESARRFAENNITKGITDTYVYSSDGALQFEYHSTGNEPVVKWHVATGGWSSL